MTQYPSDPKPPRQQMQFSERTVFAFAVLIAVSVLALCAIAGYVITQVS